MQRVQLEFQEALAQAVSAEAVASRGLQVKADKSVLLESPGLQDLKAAQELQEVRDRPVTRVSLETREI